MTLTSEKDKRQHALLCAAASIIVVALVWLGQSAGYWAAAFAGGCAMAWGYEFLQRYRGEGVFSHRDAIAGCIGSAIVSAAVAAAEFALKI